MSNYWIIRIIIGIIVKFSSNYSSLGSIFSIFSGNFAIFRSNIAHLTQNVVLLDICNIAQIAYIAQYIQLFTQLSLLQLCINFIQQSIRILAIKLALNMHSIYRMKNKSYVNLRGGIKQPKATDLVVWLKSLNNEDFKVWLDHAIYNKMVIPKQVNARIKKLVRANKLSPFYWSIAHYNKGV